MSRSERPHHDKDCKRRENPAASRYTEERSRKPYPSNGRPSLHHEHSRPPTVFVDTLPRYPAPSHVSSELSQFHPPKETFSEKCGNLCSRRAQGQR
uniref:Uncharacterized protein n=1 Tax=Sphaerodactylus townsendi TaxID=933632 RepID=A0ACB8FBW0_9SAUR